MDEMKNMSSLTQEVDRFKQNASAQFVSSESKHKTDEWTSRQSDESWDSVHFTSLDLQQRHRMKSMTKTGAAMIRRASKVVDV